MVDETTVAGHLLTAGLPDPDLLIRTSGEKRVSPLVSNQCQRNCFEKRSDRADVHASPVSLACAFNTRLCREVNRCNSVEIVFYPDVQL